MKKRSPFRQFLDFLIDAFYQLISLRSNTYRWKRRQFDRVLAKHYGFTDEELDFIINYDIKYRMGKDDGD